MGTGARVVRGTKCGVYNRHAIMNQIHEIAKERLAIMERGRLYCYYKDEMFLELVKMGVLENIQHDAMLFMINDPTKIRVFFGVPTD